MLVSLNFLFSEKVRRIHKNAAQISESHAQNGGIAGADVCGAGVSVSSSVLTIAVLSADRLLAVRRPLSMAVYRASRYTWRGRRAASQAASQQVLAGSLHVVDRGRRLGGVARRRRAAARRTPTAHRQLRLRTSQHLQLLPRGNAPLSLTHHTHTYARTHSHTHALEELPAIEDRGPRYYPRQP